jgi:Cys-tRNA(Pro)/Cys-tRNA(Cys) deacylase
VASKGTPATALLRRLGTPFTIHPYDVAPTTPNYGARVAAALGVEPARVFKTLVANVDGKLAVGVVPVTGSLNLKALAAALGGKRASMAEPAVAERATGYVTGGISPFAQRSRLPIVVDSSATDWPTVFVSGGRRGVQLEVAPGDLISVVTATTAPISDAAAVA